jgi:hypothetical protein
MNANSTAIMKAEALVCIILFALFISYTTLGQVPTSTVWDNTIGTNGLTYMKSEVATSDGGLIIGTTTLSSNGADKSELSRGGFDYWVVKLRADGSKAWDKTYGGSGDDFFKEIILLPDGHIIIAGISNSNSSGDKSEQCKGEFDYWVIKLKEDGSKVWDRTIGGSGDDHLFYNSLIATADGGILIAGTSDSGLGGNKTVASKGRADYWVVKLNSDGTKAWDKTYGGSEDDYLTDFAALPGGGYMLLGTSESGVSGDKSEPSRGESDYWLIKLNANGNKVWDKTYGGKSREYAPSLKVTADGGCIVWGGTISGVGGDKSEPSRGKFDGWLIKLKANGSKAWDKTIGASGDDVLKQVILATGGGYLLCLASENGANGDRSEPTKGGYDYWVVKLNADGKKAWDKTYGGKDRDSPSRLIHTADGGFLIAGTSKSGAEEDKSEPSRGGSDYWVVKLNANGKKVWDKTYGGSRDEHLTSILRTSDDNYFLIGNSESPAGEDKTHASRGKTDVWVVKISISTQKAEYLAEADEVEVYPNPSTEDINVKFKTASEKEINLLLYSSDGQVIMKQAVTNSELEHGAKLATKDFSEGVYFLQVYVNERVLTKKIIMLR